MTKHISITRAGDMDSCPRLYHCRHELKTPVVVTPAMELGKLWESMLVGEPIGFVPPMLETRLAVYYETPGALLPVMKENWQPKLWKPIPDTDYHLLGYADYLIPDTVIEYKFAMKPWTPKKAAAFYTLRQVYGYGWGFEKEKYQFHVANLQTLDIQIFTGNITKRNVSDTLRWLRRMIERIESSDRDPTANPLCDYCGFKPCDGCIEIPEDTPIELEDIPDGNDIDLD